MIARDHAVDLTGRKGVTVEGIEATTTLAGPDWGSWGTSANWSPPGVPGPTDYAHIEANDKAKVSTTADCKTVRVSSGGWLWVAAGGYLDATAR